MKVQILEPFDLFNLFIFNDVLSPNRVYAFGSILKEGIIFICFA